MVRRAEATASGAEEELVHATRVRELKREIEELHRLAARQAVNLQILEQKGIV